MFVVIFLFDNANVIFKQSKGEIVMKKKTLNGVLLILAVATAFVFAGCTTVPVTGITQRVEWTQHTLIPNKNYDVVGTVVLRAANSLTINADLMERAVAMGGHDIINVRIDIERSRNGRERFLAGSAVVIRYKDETLMENMSTTVVTNSNGVVTTETHTSQSYFGSGAAASMGGSIISSTITPEANILRRIFR